MMQGVGAPRYSLPGGQRYSAEDALLTGTVAGSGGANFCVFRDAPPRWTRDLGHPWVGIFGDRFLAGLSL